LYFTSVFEKVLKKPNSFCRVTGRIKILFEESFVNNKMFLWSQNIQLVLDIFSNSWKGWWSWRRWLLKNSNQNEQTLLLQTQIPISKRRNTPTTNRFWATMFVVGVFARLWNLHQWFSQVKMSSDSHGTGRRMTYGNIHYHSMN